MGACTILPIGWLMADLLPAGGDLWSLIGALAALVLVSMIPFIVARARRSFDPLELILGFTAIYFLQFGIGSAIQPFLPIELRHARDLDLLAATTTWATVGYAAFVVGYYALVRSGPATLPTAASWSAPRLAAVLVTFEIAGWAARAYRVAQGGYFHLSSSSTIPPGANFWVSVASSLPLIAVLMLGIARRFRIISGPYTTILYLLLVLAETAFSLPTGSKFAVLEIGLVVLLPWLLHGATSIKRLVLISVLFSVGYLGFLHPFINVQRNQSLGSPNSGTSIMWDESLPVTAKLEASLNLLFDLPLDTYLEIALIHSLARFSNVQGLAESIRLYPDQVPFRLGETYFWFMTIPIPRALWPDKPDYGSFGVEFGVLTGVAPHGGVPIGATLIGESWFNFGPMGVACFMLLFGIISRLAYDRLRSGPGGRAPSPMLIYSIVYIDLVTQFENIFVMTFGSLIEMVALMVVCTWYLAGGVTWWQQHGARRPRAQARLASGA